MKYTTNNIIYNNLQTESKDKLIYTFAKHNAMPPLVSQEQREHFDKDGVVFLKGVFDIKWMDIIARGIDKNKADMSQYGESIQAHPGDPGRYFNDYLNWKRIPEYNDYVLNSVAKDIAGELLNSNYVSYYYEHVLTKDAGAQKVTPWHMDQSYFPIDGDKCCSIWMPIDPVPEATTLRFVKGSHKFGKWFNPRKFETAENYVRVKDDEKEWEDLPDIDANLDGYEVLKWACEPGDCIVFHFKALHGAPGNTLATPRRVISTRWCGDDCYIADRPWVPSPPETFGLKNGDPLTKNEEWFPTLWRK
ncbi:unnamed protein product [Owenia fusiformis]|uniref:Phytanoyl-CoA dioxygenase n=1 Tax=Owenia fusiformis TaxID=6347 RepID=A0A8S4NCX1_OWEFU|nr:unnamed protein product [Owenia fusiformis]